MTEDEAKKKWCPFVRIADIDGALNNRCKPVMEERTTVGQASGCIGSACMAWREIKPTGLKFIPCDDQFAFIEPSRPDHVPNSWLWNNGTPEHLLAHYQNSQAAGWRESEEAAHERLGGYCGLAGNP